MAAYKALVSFAGRVSMYKGQVKNLTDTDVIADLLRAGYIEEIEQKKPVRRTTKRTAKKTDTE